MIEKDEVLRTLRAHLPRLRTEYGVRKLSLCGSVARGTQSEQSDVDLAVEFAHPIGLRFVELAEHLEHLLGVKTDILTPAGITAIRNPRISKSIQESVIDV